MKLERLRERLRLLRLRESEDVLRRLLERGGICGLGPAMGIPASYNFGSRNHGVFEWCTHSILPKP